jgi:hypothetical protein
VNILHPDTALILSLFVSLFIPLLSSLLAKSHWDGAVIGMLTLVLTTANGFLTEWSLSNDAGHYDWKTALGITLYSFLFAVFGRLALWKNTRLDAKLLAVGSGTGPVNPPAQHAV